MHYLSTKKGTRYQSLTTENWPFQCSQLTVGRIVIVFLFSGTEAKYSNNNHLLATVNIHPKSQFPASFRQSLAHFSSSLLTGGLASTLVVQIARYMSECLFFYLFLCFL